MIQAGIVYQSLLPDSRVLKFGVGLTIFAATLGNVANAPLYTAFLAGSLAVALGYSALRYRQSEICKQVPGLYRAQAIAALQVAVCLWGLFILPALKGDGSFMFAAGSCFLAMTIGLCIGAGDLILVYWLFAAGLMSSALLPLWIRPPLSNESAWPNWPLVVFESVGVSMLLAGIAFLFRYWKLHNQSTEIAPVSGSKLSTASNSCQGWEEFTDERELQKIPRFQMFRFKKLLEFKQTYKTRDYFWLGLSLAIVLSAIVVSRGIESSVMFVQYIAAGAVMGAPAMVFFQRIQESFERLWLIGSSTTRVETVRRKVVLASWNCFVFLLFVVAALALHSPTNLLAYVTSIAILLVAHGCGALLLVASSKMYGCIMKHQNAIMLICCVLLMTITVVMFSVTEGKAEFARSIVSGIGMVNSILAASTFAIGCWVLCLLDGGRGMASNDTLME